MPPQLERRMESMNTERARILQTLCRGKGTDKGGDTKAVLRALRRVNELFDHADGQSPSARTMPFGVAPAKAPTPLCCERSSRRALSATASPATAVV
jgi:hypothetical protein